MIFKILCIASVLVTSPLAWAAGQPGLNIKNPWGKSSKNIKLDRTARDLLLNPSHQLILAPEKLGTLFKSTRYQHQYKGLTVVGSASVTLSNDRSETVFNHLAEFDLDVVPTVSTNEAVQIAQSHLGWAKNLNALPELKILPSFKKPGQARLAYWVHLKGQDMWDAGGQVVLDAHTGRIIAVVPDALTIAPVQVVSAAKASYATDPYTGQPNIWMIQWNALDHVVKDGVPTEDATETAKRAASNAEKVLKYYMENFNRDSFDDKGTDSTSAVHIGTGYSNAFWLSSAKIMGYGDGDGKRFGDFTRSLDVAGHEMTHGVISQTAKLEYWAESGALNESLADFFGEMIEGNDNWVLGEDLYLNAAESVNGIRNIKNPGVRSVVIGYDNKGNAIHKPYPSEAKEMFETEEDEDSCDSSNDNCWVHVNSLVPTRAAYFMTKLIGKPATMRILYSTLEYNLLTELSNFKHFKEVTMKACEMIYDPLYCARGVLPAFEQVGL